MKRRFRLTSTTDFKRVRRFGKSYAHPLIVLVVLPNELERVRVGVSAGRSMGNAVQRNRAKRVLRAAIQPYLAALVVGWDCVLIARQPLGAASFGQVQSAISGLLGRAGLLQDSNDS